MWQVRKFRDVFSNNKGLTKDKLKVFSIFNNSNCITMKTQISIIEAIQAFFYQSPSRPFPHFVLRFLVHYFKNQNQLSLNFITQYITQHLRKGQEASPDDTL